MEIPKIIHYCWFGGGQIPEENQAYIQEWKRVCPDYEIRKWDESNYNIKKIAFMREAAATKNWTFIADYARFDIINTYGGIYLDVDVQTINNYDEFLHLCSFWGMEKDFDRQLYVNPGLGFGSIPNNPILNDLLKLYQVIHFDEKNIVGSPALLRDFFETRGFVQKNRLQEFDFGNIYPVDFFAPLDCFGSLKTTKNTVSIHHYLGSWFTDPTPERTMLYRKCVYLFGRKIGEYVFYVLRRFKGID